MIIHFLDVGGEKYGDCILCVEGNQTILIDGAHLGDWRSRDGHRSIPDQLEELLGPPPFRVSLLVVTHVHADHIGCLPKLVEEGKLKPEWALVADEKLGFGRSADDALTPLDLDTTSEMVKKLVAALREEPREDLLDSPAKFAEFLNDAMTMEQRYRGMLKELQRGMGAGRLVRYGRDSTTALENAFAPMRLKILGPTPDHLVVCAEAIAEFTRDAYELVADLVAQRDYQDARSLYQTLVSRPLSDAMDRPGKGAAINDQSIVLSLGRDNERVLLTGDMQLAKAEVRGLNEYMHALRRVIQQNGPYQLVKLAHHSSYNGCDRDVLAEFGDSPFLVHTGGVEDATHPDVGVLKLLRGLRRRDAWARTDRNGLISCTLGQGAFRVELEKGRLNDFTPNHVDLPTPKVAAALPAVVEPVRSSSTPGGGSAAVVRAEVSGTPGVVEVVTRIPHTTTRVTITIDVQPKTDSGLVPQSTSGDPGSTTSGAPGAASVPQFSIGGGRQLPKLLVVTNQQALRDNIGEAESRQVFSSIRAAGLEMIEVPANQASPGLALGLVREKLAAQKFEGVLLLGGYDVVPSIRFDSLDPDTRSKLPRVHSDPDNFIVWSDASYGDIDRDGLPELPVSRIPDGKSANLVYAALQAGPSAGMSERFSLRNRERPFADGIHTAIPGSSACRSSEPTGPVDYYHAEVAIPHVYLMLHGADWDGTTFWGEDDDGVVEAFNVGNVPPRFDGIVLTGCCWGALVAQSPAAQASSNQLPIARSEQASLALRFLGAGAWAFVGCTGAHYSPTSSPYGYFGGPMHEAFWAGIRSKLPPAPALFDARRSYLRGFPHGRTHVIERAIELKILHQFTCLGLGW